MIRSKMSVKQYFFHFLTTCITLVFFSNVFAGPVTFSLTSIKPAKGSTAGGTDVTIKGTGFTAGATATLIAGAPCTNLVVVSAKKITCTTTAHAPGLTDLLVTNGNGEFLILGKSFKYVKPPIVESIDPAFGPVAGGTLVSIYGTNFKPGASAKVGGIDCTMPTVVSPTEVKCTTGQHSAGLADVTVINPGNISGTLTNGYEYLQDHWSSTSDLYAPSARNYHTAIWTGSKMIVWGGQSDSGYLNTGGIYDSINELWDEIAITEQTPYARQGQSGLWTGSKMIIWGGATNTEFTNTGAIYDPISGQWTPTSTVNGTLEGKTGHSSVWTGSKMIVWGGYGSFGAMTNTGMTYDPSTDTWTSMSQSDYTPSSRAIAPAIWTGTEMIVWGGIDGSSAGTGAKYNPSTDTWTSITPSADTPIARHFHSAVWTGTEMIVWGGLHTDGISEYYDLNDGKKYNPLTDQWHSMSSVNAPSARRDHSSVWTGTEMIVWGGVHQPSGQVSTFLADGKKYNPSTDTWTDITIVNVPTARGYHSAIWTGEQMIVWGGIESGWLRTNTGGIYTP